MNIINARMRELLRATVAELRQGEQPLSHRFLVEHEVTLDEAYSLAEWLAIGCAVLEELDTTSHGQKIIVTGMAISAMASSETPKERPR